MSTTSLRSEKDGATVPDLLRESACRLPVWTRSEKPNIDPDFEEVTEGEEVESKEHLKSKWTQLEVVVGADNRIKQIAKEPHRPLRGPIGKYWTERPWSSA